MPKRPWLVRALLGDKVLAFCRQGEYDKALECGRDALKAVGDNRGLALEVMASDTGRQSILQVESYS